MENIAGFGYSCQVEECQVEAAVERVVERVDGGPDLLRLCEEHDREGDARGVTITPGR